MAENPKATTSQEHCVVEVPPITFQYPHIRLLPDYRDHNYDGVLDATKANQLKTVGNDAATGRYPFPIICQSGSRVSKSMAAVLMDSALNAWVYEVTAEHDQGKTVPFLRDRLWMHCVALGTGDMRVRGWADLCRTTRADEYFDSDAFNPVYTMIAPGFSPVRDLLDNNMTGRAESGASDPAKLHGFTTKPIWNKQWKDGAFAAFNEAGRYFADRKVVKRVNLNEVVSPFVAMSLMKGYVGEGEGSGISIVPMTLIGQKPQRGFPYINDWRRRTSLHCGIRFNAIWRDNLWGGASSEVNLSDEFVEAVNRNRTDGWSSAVTVAPSPVYTAFILAQRLNIDGEPLVEEKLRVTVERTWDGKMNVLEYGLLTE